MTKTTTQFLPSTFNVTALAFTLAMTASSTLPAVSGIENVAVLKESLASQPTASCSQLILSKTTWQELTAARIKALRGKYRHVLTPSEEFARQKQEEIVRERDVT